MKHTMYAASLMLCILVFQGCSSVRLNSLEVPTRIEVFAEEIILAPLMVDTCLIYSQVYGEVAASRIEIVTRTRNEIDGEIVDMLIDGHCMKPLENNGLSDLGPPQRVEVYSESVSASELLEDTCAVYEFGYGLEALKDVVFTVRKSVRKLRQVENSSAAVEHAEAQLEAKCPPYELSKPAKPELSRDAIAA